MFNVLSYVRSGAAQEQERERGDGSNVVNILNGEPRIVVVLSCGKNSLDMVTSLYNWIVKNWQLYCIVYICGYRIKLKLGLKLHYAVIRHNLSAKRHSVGAAAEQPYTIFKFGVIISVAKKHRGNTIH